MNSSTKTIKKLSLAVVGMFCFGFMLVPIYDIFCDITGLNGKITGLSYLNEKTIVSTKQREILIQFVTHNNESMPWSFQPQINQIKVKTGEPQEIFFTFENNTPNEMIGQVIPSVSPGRGAQYFHKTECFCFEQQKLLPKEKIDLPVKFIIDPALPKDIGSLSLGYTLFDITNQVKNKSQLAGL